MKDSSNSFQDYERCKEGKPNNILLYNNKQTIDILGKSRDWESDYHTDILHHDSAPNSTIKYMIAVLTHPIKQTMHS